jgi:hypothetical protein
MFRRVSVTIGRRDAARRDSRSLLLWTVDGEPVSMAGDTPVAGRRPASVRCARHWSIAGTRSGRRSRPRRPSLRWHPGAEEVALSTDLRNLASNTIYAEIGYRPVRD